MSSSLHNVFIASTNQIAGGILNYNKLADVTADGSSATLNVITGMSSGYTSLQLFLVGVKNGNNSQMVLRFNGDSGNNYSYNEMFGLGATISGAAASGVDGISLGEFKASKQLLANIFITNFTTAVKPAISYAGCDNGQYSNVTGGYWNNNAEITQIDIADKNGNLVSGTRAILLGSAI